jgi:hypothetical protein
MAYAGCREPGESAPVSRIAHIGPFGCGSERSFAE